MGCKTSSLNTVQPLEGIAEEHPSFLLKMDSLGVPSSIPSLGGDLLKSNSKNRLRVREGQKGQLEETPGRKDNSKKMEVISEHTDKLSSRSHSPNSSGAYQDTPSMVMRSEAPRLFEEISVEPNHLNREKLVNTNPVKKRQTVPNRFVGLSPKSYHSPSLNSQNSRKTRIHSHKNLRSYSRSSVSSGSHLYTISESLSQRRVIRNPARTIDSTIKLTHPPAEKQSDSIFLNKKADGSISGFTELLTDHSVSGKCSKRQSPSAKSFTKQTNVNSGEMVRKVWHEKSPSQKGQVELVGWFVPRDR